MLKKTKKTVQKLTFRLHDSRRDGPQEILGRHEDFPVAVIGLDLQGGEVPEYLIWSGILANGVLVLNNLHGKGMRLQGTNVQRDARQIQLANGRNQQHSLSSP